MRIRTIAVLGFVMSAGAYVVATQAPSPSAANSITFDVVSIKRPSGASRTTINHRPDGGFSATNYPVALLIARAYEPAIPGEMIGLPSWAITEKYDVRATSTLSSATRDERKSMLRAMLADRFKLVAHFEQREQPVYELVLARSNGALGPGMKPSEIDCIAQQAAQRTEAQESGAAGTSQPRPRVEREGRVPPCAVRISGPSLEGDLTMAVLATLLRRPAGRHIVDKTGLTGSYSVKMEFEQLSGRTGGDSVETTSPPSVFTAVQEQLGLKLVPSRAKLDVLVIDHLERPTENNVP